MSTQRIAFWAGAGFTLSTYIFVNQSTEIKFVILTVMAVVVFALLPWWLQVRKQVDQAK